MRTGLRIVRAEADWRPVALVIGHCEASLVGVPAERVLAALLPSALRLLDCLAWNQTINLFSHRQWHPQGTFDTWTEAEQALN